MIIEIPIAFDVAAQKEKQQTYTITEAQAVQFITRKLFALSYPERVRLLTQLKAKKATSRV